MALHSYFGSLHKQSYLTRSYNIMSMSIRSRFLLAIISCFLVVMIIGGLLINHQQARHFEEEVIAQSKMVNSFSQACREYIKGELRPRLQNEGETFIVEGMSGTYATRRVMEKFNEYMPGFSYRQPTYDPLNLINKADQYDIKLLDTLHADRSIKELTGYNKLDNHEYFYVARPIIVEADCLDCHGDPDIAPVEITTLYGKEHGYNWKVDDIVSMSMITVPVYDMREGQAAIMKAIVITFVLLTILVVALTFILFDRLVNKHIRTTTDLMKRITIEKGTTLRLYEKAPGEFGTMARVFNIMADTVKANTTNLERKVNERTTALTSEIAYRKKREQELLKLTTAVEQSPCVVVITDPGGAIEYVNPRFVKTTGYAINEVLGQNPRILKSGNTPQNYYSEMWDTITSGQIWQGEFHNKRKNGEMYWEATSISPVLDEAGCIVNFVAVKEDITSRKLARDEKVRFSRVLENSLNEIYIFDTTTLHFTEVNHGARKNLGYTIEELHNMTPLDLIPEFSYEYFMELVQPLLAGTQENIQFSTVHLRKDGSLYPVEVHLEMVGNESPVFVAFIIDITERNKYLSLLEEAKESAESANRTKSEFLANMSHEIRTPMTAILGFTDILLEYGDLENTPPDRIDAAYTIKRNGEYLLQLINDILDLSKIEANKLEVENIPCSPVQIITDIHSLMCQRAERKGLTFEIEYIGSIPEYIHSDPTRLRQILVNLIGNAIKFTDTKGIRIITKLTDVVSVYGSTISELRLQIDIVDSGIGMTAEQLDKLFTPFSQADSSTTRNFGGTGLGLAISKRFANMLGGNITVQSQPGQGSTFSITISTGSLDNVKMLSNLANVSINDSKLEKLPQKNITAVNLNCKILLAEDGMDNQRLITYILNKAGAEVMIVENGQQVVDKVLANRIVDPENMEFDLILMDMQMPVMDGYEATAILRQQGYYGPIIALTANAMTSDRDKCLAAGCDDYATKPVDKLKLIEMISSYTRGIKSSFIS